MVECHVWYTGDGFHIKTFNMSLWNVWVILEVNVWPFLKLVRHRPNPKQDREHGD